MATATCGAVRVSRWARPAGLSVRNGVPPLPLDAAPTITEASVGGSRAVALSTTSATMQVMLSGPPPLMASSTSCRTTSFRSSTLASVRCRVSSLTTPDSPSEQSRYRSPSLASRSDRSGSTSARPSRARSSMDRCGWVATSSGLIRPSSTSVWTSVWSCVIWWNSPSRSRYARESPMCTRATRGPDQSMAVSVVPMPSSTESATTMSCSVWFASATASASASSRSWPGTSSSSLARAEMAAALATSPAAWPPMPSATASRRGPAYAASSFPSRRRPTSERIAYRSASVICAIPERSCRCGSARLSAPGSAGSPSAGRGRCRWLTRGPRRSIDRLEGTAGHVGSKRSHR